MKDIEKEDQMKVECMLDYNKLGQDKKEILRSWIVSSKHDLCSTWI
mgnify:CR=1 FL=1